MKIITDKHLCWIRGLPRKRLSRKAKKRIIGNKITKSKLNKLLKTVVLGPPIKTMFENREIYPFPFCPKCGNKSYLGSGNMSIHPEHWEKFNCIRCYTIVAYIDNSPFIHALECKDNGYDPIF